MNDNNLKPIRKEQLSKEESKERSRNGGLKSVEVRREKKTIADILSIWAEKPLSEANKEAMKKAGFDEATTNKALLVLPLIKNASKGDIRAIQMAMDLLNEDKKKEAEIRKLEAEIERLKLEAERLKREMDGDLPENRIVVVSDIPKVNRDGED